MISVTEKRMTTEGISLDKKTTCLDARLKELGRAAVAFSGGADSALLAYRASLALGGDAYAMTIWSPLLSRKDREQILAFCEMYDIPLIRVAFDETSDSEFAENGPDRCYRCKSLRLQALCARAREWDIPWVLDGSNVDDLSDYRPGMRALAEYQEAVSPLLECGFTKNDIRTLSRHWGLPTAKKPSAACLASRIPTEVRIEKELLTAIDNGEEIVRAYLPENAQVRLRYNGKKAKIETDRVNIPGLSLKFDLIEKELRTLGIDEASISDEGYKMGNVTLRPK